MAEPIIRPTNSETHRSDLSRAPVVSIASHETFNPTLVTIDEIYHSPESIGSPYLRSALRLISKALGDVDSALELLGDGDKVGSDDAMQHFQVILPELFACRSIGEGFGLLVSALLNAVNQATRATNGRTAGPCCAVHPSHITV